MDQVEKQEEFVTVGELWSSIQEKLSAAEGDLLKSARGVNSAGSRARKQLRAVKKDISNLVKLTVEIGKAARAARNANKSAAE